MKKIQDTTQLHYYEVCFYGSENPESPNYDAVRECSYAIKTEIPPEKMDIDTALNILFCNTEERNRYSRLIDNCTAVNEITKEEAENCFFVETLTVRIVFHYQCNVAQYGFCMLYYLFIV